MDAATVAAITAALRANAAAAARDGGLNGTARANGLGGAASTSALAREAYDKLQFDYPIIRAQALDALATTMRKALRMGDVETMRAYALTTMLVRGVTEGAQAGRTGGELVATLDARDDADTEVDDVVDDVRRAYQNLCTVICVELTHVVLKMDDDAAYETLRLYAPDERARETGELDEDASALDAVGDVRDALPVDEASMMSVVGSSDDDDWQPLESTSTWFAPPVGDSEKFERMSRREAVDAKLHALVGELIPSRVGADAIKTNARASWETTNAGDSVLKLFEACCDNTINDARRALRTIPLRVLRERWARVPLGTFGVDSGLARALAALKFDVKQTDVVDQRIALELLAYLCVQLGADTIGGCGVDVRHGSISATARSKLWVHVNKAVPVVTCMLEQSLRVMTRERDNSEWQDSVGLSALLLTFYVGNANALVAQDVGERLVHTGCIRALVNIFIATRSSPFAEAVRRALLLACLSSDAVFNFVSQVPTARDAALTDGEFAENGALSGHGAIWPVALRESGAEDTMARHFDYFAEHMHDERVVVALQSALPLLRACVRAAQAGGRMLYIESGPVPRALQRVYAKTTEVVAATTRVRNELRNSTSTCVGDDDDDDKKKRVEHPLAPDVEKRRESIVDISRTLKVLLSPSGDTVAARKAD